MFAEKITAAGFTLETDGHRLIVKPSGKLTDQQRQFISAHKAEIIAELTAAANDGLDDVALAEVLRRACADLGMEPADLWRFLSTDDIEAIRRDPEGEFPALRCCARIWSRTPPEVPGGHNLPLPSSL